MKSCLCTTWACIYPRTQLSDADRRPQLGACGVGLSRTVKASTDTLHHHLQAEPCFDA